MVNEASQPRPQKFCTGVDVGLAAPFICQNRGVKILADMLHNHVEVRMVPSRIRRLNEKLWGVQVPSTLTRILILERNLYKVPRILHHETVCCVGKLAEQTLDHTGEVAVGLVLQPATAFNPVVPPARRPVLNHEPQAVVGLGKHTTVEVALILWLKYDLERLT